MLAARTGARLRFVPIGEDGTLALVRLASLLDGAKLFAFTHISNSLGTINPARELCQAARAAGVVTLVDAAQSAGHMPIDVAEIGCDFLALSGHKMCGPTGIGVLYGRPDLLEEMPPWHGGGEMIVSVDWERSSFKKAPHRFEAGTPHISGAVGLAAAIAYLEDVGRGRIFAHDQQLAAYALEQLGAVRGVRVIGPRAGQARAGVVSFVMDAAHPHDLTTYADQGGLALRGGHHCNQPLMRKLGLPGTARASFYFYNTRAEIDRMLQILEDAHRFFS
jgi:cysteine desulfurase/selenocysteine lyase